MDKAKAAVSDFLGRSGHHDTTVHEHVAPAVQHETVKTHQHDNVTTAVDKEVHQDHHHRTVQPVHDREVLPEQHSHRMAAVEKREFDHRDHDTLQRNLAQEQDQFKDSRRVQDTTTSQSAASTVGGEHVHHHIHETIQPVVHKETIQSNVVHTTQPIHEIHHNQAKHHGASTLPAMTMDEFKSQGGALTGRGERSDQFEGAPRKLGNGNEGFGENRHHGHGQHTHHQGEGALAGAAATGAAMEAGKHGHHGQHQQGQHGLGGVGATGAAMEGGQHHQHGQHGHHQGEGALAGAAATGTAMAAERHGQHGQHGQHGLQQGERGLGGVGAMEAGQHHQHGQHGHHQGEGALAGAAATGAAMEVGKHGHHGQHQQTGGLTGSSTSGGLTGHDQHQHADRGQVGQGNMTGSSTQGGVVSDNRQDSNLTSNRGDSTQAPQGTHGTHGKGDSTGYAKGVVEGVGGDGKNNLAHRNDESGDLPKALTEPVSKAVPHSEIPEKDAHETHHTKDSNVTHTS